MSIMDEIILDIVTLDEIKFVAFCYMCLLSITCVLYQHYVLYFNPLKVYQFLNYMDKVLDDLYVFLIP